jgi:hypothetical protein
MRAQVYTYMLRPVSRMEGAAAAAAAAAAASSQQRPSLDAGGAASSSSSVHGGDSSGGGAGGVTEVVVAWELLLVMEYCELVSLRTLSPTPQPSFHKPVSQGRSVTSGCYNMHAATGITRLWYCCGDSSQVEHPSLVMPVAGCVLRGVPI